MRAARRSAARWRTAAGASAGATDSGVGELTALGSWVLDEEQQSLNVLRAAFLTGHCGLGAGRPFLLGVPPGPAELRRRGGGRRHREVGQVCRGPETTGRVCQMTSCLWGSGPTGGDGVEGTVCNGLGRGV